MLKIVNDFNFVILSQTDVLKHETCSTFPSTLSTAMHLPSARVTTSWFFGASMRQLHSGGSNVSSASTFSLSSGKPEKHKNLGSESLTVLPSDSRMPYPTKPSLICRFFLSHYDVISNQGNMQQKVYIFTKGQRVCCHVVLLPHKVRMLCLKPVSAHFEINLSDENKRIGSIHIS